MQVKKFEAPSMQEALNLVKTELGPEAIILSTKNHRKGFGLLSKASVEVTAAVADKSLMKKSITERVVPPQTKAAVSKLPAAKQAEIYNDFSGYYTERADRIKNRNAAPTSRGVTPNEHREQNQNRQNQQKEAPPNQSRVQSRAAAAQRYIDISDDDEETPQQSGYGRNGKVPTQAAQNQSSYNAAPVQTQQSLEQYSVAPVASLDVEALQEDIKRLKMMLEEIKIEQVALNDSKIADSSSDELQVEFNNLLRNGIDKRFATPLIKQVTFSVPRESIRDSAKIVETLAVEIMENVKIDHPIDYRPGSERKVFALLGPTGVGKTTTIAKLASQAILQKNLRVGLINVDTYKVAATDQLATYAKILNVPFRQASNALELDRALQEFKPLDLVLIDTSGRSQRDSESLTQMRSLLSENPQIRPLLIMSATTRDQELYDIVNRFKIFNPTGLIFSKLDESATFGCIYNVSLKTKLPLTYFTVGQRVPEDIEPASRERLADLILDLQLQ